MEAEPRRCMGALSPALAWAETLSGPAPPAPTHRAIQVAEMRP